MQNLEVMSDKFDTDKIFIATANSQLSCLQEPGIFIQLAEISENKFWEELIAYFSLIQHGLHRKLCV
jgi:hypothetical protein